MMQVMNGGGSSSVNPENSYDNVAPRGYGDGYGGYGTYGASYHGKGKGWRPWQPHPEDRMNPDYGNDIDRDLYIWTPELGRTYGPPPRPKYPAQRPLHYAGTYGAKGGGSKSGNQYVVQAPMGPGSEIIYPLRKGDGKAKGKGKQEEEQADTSGGSALPPQRRGWRKERREASRSRSDSRPTTGPPGHWAFVPEQPQHGSPPRGWVGAGGAANVDSPSPEGTAPLRANAKASPARAASTVKIEEVEADLMDVEGDASGSPDARSSQSPQPTTPDHLARIGYGVVLTNDAKAIQAQMEAVQMLIIALKGRSDEYSMKGRAGLEADLHALRVRKTRLKPLEDQNAILEALVEKRTTHFSQTEHNVQSAIAEMEAAKQSLLVAQQQLIQVRTLKAVEDAAKAERAQQAEVPDNMKSLEKVKDLVCLLPNGMADGFGQCLKMLETLLHQASTSTVTYAATLDSESVCSGAATGMPEPTDPYMESLNIPMFPGTAAGGVEQSQQPLQERSSESGPAREGSHTPTRRGRSVEPERSPATRSRSHSASRPFRGKMESMEEAFSRREGRPGGPP